MKHPAPRPDRTATPYFEAASQQRLSLPCPPGGGRPHWPPREGDVWRDFPGTGAVASFAVVHRAVDPELRGRVPYILAFVALDSGARVLTNLVGVDPKAVAIGMPVHVVFEPTENPDFHAPVFAPVGEQG